VSVMSHWVLLNRVFPYSRDARHGPGCNLLVKKTIHVEADHILSLISILGLDRLVLDDK
jgi:hypothetical protein